MEQHANTSAASIPLALAVAVDDGRIKNGDVIAMEAIGGGLVWGAALVKFGKLAKFMEMAKLLVCTYSKVLNFMLTSFLPETHKFA